MSIRAWLVFAVLFVLTGCARSSSAPPPAPARETLGPSGAVVREVVTTVDVDLRVTDVEATATKLRTETERAGGYVEHGTMTGDADDRSASYDLRIPKSELVSVRKTIGLGRVESENEKVDDVTQQHADIDARLRNARAHETRLLEIMANRAGTVGELLDTEKELARVREDVEKLDAQKRTLDGQIDLATIHVLVSHATPSMFETPGKSIAHAWSAGLHGARAFFVCAAMVLAASSPTLVPIFAMVAFFVWLARRARRPREI
jgi:hypothetical protein